MRNQSSICRGLPAELRTSWDTLRTRTGADSSTTDNHATSALKFEILSELLHVGVSVLLSDVDVPFLQNPFGMLTSNGVSHFVNSF